jgi:two-component sensor histidine kinase
MNDWWAWAVRFSRRGDSWFAGLTWTGLGLLALLCLANALRRTLPLLVVNGEFLPACEEFLPACAVAFVTGLIFALPVALAVVAYYNHAPPGTRLHWPALIASFLLSSAVAAAVAVTIEVWVGSMGVDDESLWTGLACWWLQFWPRNSIVGALFCAVYVYFRRGEESAAAAHEAERQRLQFEQRMEEARLQVLQAQIEPHFLFNTLATVRRLYQTDRTAAAAMLDNLMRYLAVALPQMRATDSTLGREAALAEAYLNIQRIRMGRRLSFAIDVAEALEAAKLPPMMLLTLAENAVKHGLTPLPEGGFIRISANVEAQRLRVAVADSGQGFTRNAGGGTGLANIRARLAAGYGRDAQLSIARNHPRGVTATLVLPFATAAAAVPVPT